MPVPRLDTHATALLIVDMQEKLLATMDQPDTLIQHVVRLIRGVDALGLPVIATEQYPKGLGPTAPQVAQWLYEAAGRTRQAATSNVSPTAATPGRAPGVYEKLKFSACIEPVRAALEAHAVRSVLVAGIEAHVCVQQTCYDLADAGYVVGVAHDAVDSRRALDRQVALRRMTQAGVLPMTVESALLELVREAGGDRFKVVLPLIK